jgi:anti-sigma factor RsiW
MIGPEHDGEKIQALLDGALSGEESARVTAHVETCASCGNELRAMRWVKSVAAGASEIPLPGGLRETVRRALELEERRGRRVGLRSVGWRLAAVLVVASGAAIATKAFFTDPDAPRRAARDFRAVRSGELQLLVRTTDDARLERFFEEARMPFAPRVIDLSMQSYRVAGGTVQAFLGSASTLVAYESEGGALVICQMYEGDVRELPRGAELRVHDGIEFYVFRRDGLTAVFWQEGAVTCVLTSDIDAETLIRLAFAKAIKV